MIFLDLYFCYDEEASDEDVKDEENEGDGAGEALQELLGYTDQIDGGGTGGSDDDTNDDADDDTDDGGRGNL